MWTTRLPLWSLIRSHKEVLVFGICLVLIVLADSNFKSRTVMISHGIGDGTSQPKLVLRHNHIRNLQLKNAPETSECVNQNARTTPVVFGNRKSHMHQAKGAKNSTAFQCNGFNARRPLSSGDLKGLIKTDQMNSVCV